jgi:hypothetical protein
VRLYTCTLSRTHPLATRTKGPNDSRSHESAVEYLITIGLRHCLPAQSQPWQGRALTVVLQSSGPFEPNQADKYVSL